MIKYLLLLSLIFTTEIHSSEIDSRRHIEVEANAELLVNADYAIWRIKIRGEADSLAAASKRLEESSAALKASLKNSGFTENMMKLSEISSGRYYEGPYDSRVFKGFFAERNATVELRDLAKRQQLESILLKDNRIEIISIERKSSEHDMHQQQALLKAAANAKMKATALAKSLGAELGMVLSIHQEKERFNYSITRNSIDTVLDSRTTELEKISYRSTLVVKFELK